MNSQFNDVNVLIWDFDGTLYNFVPDLKMEIRESEYRVIINHTGWSREKTVARFLPLYEKSHSGTTTAANLSGISVLEAVKEGEKYVDRGKYIGRDEKLIQLFTLLQKYTHYMLVNGVRSKTEIILRHLGIDPSIFMEIVTSEIVGVNKPNPAGFRYILGKTKLPPKQHLMIGDREKVDLEPAKKLGIKTCLVWSDRKNSIADSTLPTVYDVAKILI